MNMERSQSKDDNDEVQAQLSVYRGSSETRLLLRNRNLDHLFYHLVEEPQINREKVFKTR